MKTLDEIKQKAISGNFSEALTWLLAWGKANRADAIINIQELIGQKNRIDQSFFNRRITQEVKGIEEATLLSSILYFIQQLQNSKDLHSGIIPTYHKFNCDRIDQNDTFNKNYKIDPNSKVGYFYLTGQEDESHYGFVNKVARYQGGYLLNINNPASSTKQLAVKEIHLEASRDFEFVKKDLVRKLFSEFNIMPNDHAPILEKNLNYICEKSPLRQKMSSSDYICIFIKIEEDHWADLDIPKLVKWFIEIFCGTPLDKDFPNILFFFGVIYFEDGEDEIREEVANELENAEYVKALPELKSVSRTDVQRWFRTYKTILQLTKQERKQKMQTFFSQDTYDMETVENNLKRIIDEHNDKNLK